MDKISKSVVKKDHAPKMSGRSIFVADYSSDGVLCGKILRSKYAHATVVNVHLPKLPEGYYYVDAKDVPGDNNVDIVLDDTPVFCRGEVHYIGEAIAMLCGPDEKTVCKLTEQCEVEYELLEPELDFKCAKETFFEFDFGHGDVESAFAGANRVYDEEFETGYQEQAYLETQGMMAEPEKDGRMYVHGSAQNAYYIHNAVKRVLGCEADQVHVLQDVTGGGFGGKEDYPSILSCQVAVAAYKCKQPVRCVLERREDMECSTKRHPSWCRYRVAVKDGRVTGIDADIIFNAGAYSTVSGLVIQRGVFMALGVYNIPNVHIRGRAVKTNTTPCGAYRGFGAPQVYFAVETMMNHIAADMGIDDLSFKGKHLVKQGDMTSTCGKYHFEVPLPAMIEKMDIACDYRKKRTEYEKMQRGRYRRGTGLSLCTHGIGLNGSAEAEQTKAEVRLHKYKDGMVEILAANGEIGQGLRTTFPKIVAKELNVPLENVFFEHPDTARVPDSGPTAGSRSIMIVGELLRRAAARLKQQWRDGEDQEVEEHYRNPDYLIHLMIRHLRGMHIRLMRGRSA